MSRSRRLLRSPSSLALTDGPAAPWGGLRTLVGGGGALSAPTVEGTLRGGCGHALWEEEAGSVRKSLSSLGGGGGGGFTLIRPSQYWFFPL